MGRPRKYATPTEALAAKAARNQQHYRRRTNAENAPRFIPYMPIPSDVPSITPQDLQVRADCLRTEPSHSVYDSVHATSALSAPPLPPLPLPLPLVLQPITFHLRPEEDEVRQRQQEQLDREAAASQEPGAQEYEDRILAQLDDADSTTIYQQLTHEILSLPGGSGSGSGPSPSRERALP
jgi:hypothetical protein